MPIGIISNSLAIVIGGIIGAFLGEKLSSSFEEKITMIFGCCSLSMGVSSIVLMENMPAVVFSVIIGTGIGILLDLETLVNRAGGLMQRTVSRFVHSDHSRLSEKDFQANLLTMIVLFCVSGTGIYGSIVSGVTGDNSILLAKSILDLFTALIFACSLGYVVSLIAVPQFVIFMLFYLLGGFIIPLTTPEMINDFKACGGFLMLATGFRILKLKMFPIADMIPAMFLVFPISYWWITYILPIL